MEALAASHKGGQDHDLGPFGQGFNGLLDHTDAEREWAYDRESHVGRLDKALDQAQDLEWTVVDMKTDWKVVYPHELEN